MSDTAGQGILDNLESVYFSFNALLWPSESSQITLNFQSQDGTPAGSYTGQVAKVIAGYAAPVMSTCQLEVHSSPHCLSMTRSTMSFMMHGMFAFSPVTFPH